MSLMEKNEWDFEAKLVSSQWPKRLEFICGQILRKISLCANRGHLIF